jgi:hypothetical protein
MHCVQHPSVAATAQCQSCGAFVCATCDFILPGDIHLCPACATNPSATLSPKRRRAMIISVVLAVWCTVWLVLLRVGALAQFARTRVDKQALGFVVILVLFVPSILGVGYGFGAIEKRFRNPPALWVATIWNSVILAIFLMFWMVGMMKMKR